MQLTAPVTKLLSTEGRIPLTQTDLQKPKLLPLQNTDL